MIKRSSEGFTLIELLIVIAIIGVLAAGLLAVVDPLTQMAKGRDSGRRSDAKQLIDAVERYKIYYGVYPDSTCWWCNSRSGTNWLPVLLGSKEIKKLPMDPKNTTSPELTYYYTSNGADYCIQIGFEINVASDPDYRGYWNSTWKLRYGPYGASGGLCGSR